VCARSSSALLRISFYLYRGSPSPDKFEWKRQTALWRVSLSVVSHVVAVVFMRLHSALNLMASMCHESVIGFFFHLGPNGLPSATAAAAAASNGRNNKMLIYDLFLKALGLSLTCVS